MVALIFEKFVFLKKLNWKNILKELIYILFEYIKNKFKKIIFI